MTCYHARLSFIGICFLFSPFLAAQQSMDSVVFSKAIEDNSYFIEEAYNQEDRVVQHISNGRLSLLGSHDFAYTFTQEWPITSQKHQLSYTIGFSSLNSGNVFGFNDIILNYRYQLTGHDAPVTLAPRVSIILPAGNAKKDLGEGVLGYQVNLPASKRISNSFVCHANAGYTLFPHVETTDDENKIYHTNFSFINLGASAIWLITGKTNFMLEILYTLFHDSGTSAGYGQTIISPGFRHAFDVKNLQIVPGIAVPILLREDQAEYGMFFYLSFEHPF